MQTRYYLVLNKSTGEQTLIEAALPAQAMRVAAAHLFDCRVATPHELVALIGKGVRVIYSDAPPSNDDIGSAVADNPPAAAA